jgi:hypothetical protein
MRFFMNGSYLLCKFIRIYRCLADLFWHLTRHFSLKCHYYFGNINCPVREMIRSGKPDIEPKQVGLFIGMEAFMKFIQYINCCIAAYMRIIPDLFCLVILWKHKFV